ncbi:MAG: HEAT repeat domain-containing protein [Gemmataceae bacterium]|nr:HEAT repeat domain-containing protein [Gemmataceae bacterium]
MNRLQLTASILALAAAPLTAAPLAQAGPVHWSVGINVGPGWGGHHGPYYHPYPYYYRPYAMYAPPPAVIYEAPPAVVVRPSAVVVPSYSSPVSPEPPTYQGPVVTPLQSNAPAPNVVQAGVEQPAPTRLVSAETWLQHLGNPDEKARMDAVMELGRMRAERAVEPLTATLAGDRSPAVRDAAARALGLIGSPRSLTALTHAAQADADRDVRRSAQFAAEVIQANRR